MRTVTRTFDVKKMTAALHICPVAPVQQWHPEAPKPEDLKPCLLQVYLQVLREDEITLAGIDFEIIGDGDIDDLETVLAYSPATRLFNICEKFKMLQPSAASGRMFI